MTDQTPPPWANLNEAPRLKVAWGYTPPAASTPPEPRGGAASETSAPPTAGDLADVFAGPHVPGKPEESGAEDLAGLFGTNNAPTDTDTDTDDDAPELPADTGSEDATDDGDIGDLFATDDATPAPTTAEDTAPAPVAASPFGSEQVVPPNPFAQAEPTSAPDQGSKVASAREAAREARSSEPQAQSPAPAQGMQALARDPRYTHAEQFAPMVQRILALGAGDGDPALRSFLHRLELTRDPALDRRQRAQYQELIEPRLVHESIQIQSATDRDALFDIAYDELIGIGPLGPLWRDDTITEIMVSGPNKVTVERHGRLELTPVKFNSLEHLESTVRRLGQSSADDRAISPTNPMVTIQLPRARVQFVWRPLAVSRVAISIRKFGDLLAMDDLLRRQSVDKKMLAFLRDCVVARATILVSGGTGSGKTTFVNALSEFIPDSERVITIEDALELQLRNTHVEAFVTKEAASADDHVLFGQDQLLKAALRMRPDRIVVSEIRDGKGCATMLEAANTGHSGTMTTLHANNPNLALKRMATLLRRVEAMPDDVARQEVASAIDVVVQVVRTRGRRFVSDVSVVDNATGDITQVFEGTLPPGQDEPTFRQVHGLGADTALAGKMRDAGQDATTWEV